MKILALFIILSAYGCSVAAQSGFVSGRITDAGTGETLYGATVMKQGTAIGVMADFEGKYSLALQPGLHTIVLTFISYQTQAVENVEVKAGEVTTLNFAMVSAVSQLDEVVVTADALTDTEAGITTFRRKSSNLVDGLSKQSFGRTGDRDLGAAMRRITGVSVQDGKHVYVRGLGDRYSRTTLNGMTLPGLDPDRNDIQIDIFPTSVVEHVMVYKTFSPDLPGDFTGGIVDIETKHLTEEKSTAVSLGFGYNPEMNLVNTNLSYRGGATDWLGFDDGTRKLPFSSWLAVPDVSTRSPQIESLTRKLNPQLAPVRQTNFLNSSFSFDHSNRLAFGKYSLGYTAALAWQRSFEHFDDVQFGDYTRSDNTAENSFFAEEIRRAAVSRMNVRWSGLLSAALKSEKHQFSATLLRIQNGASQASERRSTNFDQTQATLYENILTYSQRSVTSVIVGGTHQLRNLRMDWKNAATLARTYDPDFRETSIDITNPEMPTLNTGAGAGIRRFWRDLNEFNENLKIDLTLPYGKEHKFQGGLAGHYKERAFDVFSYRINTTNRSGVPVDPDFFLAPENIWTAAERQGTYLSGNAEPTNNYEGRSQVLAAYVMTEMSFGKLKAIYGARLEKADMFYTGVNTRGIAFDDERTLSTLDVLPSVNLTYALDESTSLRASFGRTLARPSFKEKSFSQIYDPITKRFFNGNTALHQTTVDNYDLRWEKFSGDGNMVSLSAFYKQFNGHIEMVTYDVATNNFKPRNAGHSDVYGVELELRRKLAFLPPVFSNASVGTNVTLAKSAVDLRSVTINESGLSEYDSRRQNAREGEAIRTTRPMAGQAPYLVNVYVNYSNRGASWNANVSYNVQGESLSVIGAGAVPDVYTQPFHSLDLNLFHEFGPDNAHRVTLGLSNILDWKHKDLYQGYGGASAVYSIFSAGRTASLSYGYQF